MREKSELREILNKWEDLKCKLANLWESWIHIFKFNHTKLFIGDWIDPVLPEVGVLVQDHFLTLDQEQ